MMKKQQNVLLAGLLVSLSCMNTNARGGKHDGFVAGACAVVGALFATAGAVALADWCFSETDDQLIARVEGQCRDIQTRLSETMNYFGQISGLSSYVGVPKVPFYGIGESVLHEFATHVWYKNITQADYRSAVITAKNDLQSSVQTLRKRIRKLEEKRLSYEDQQRLYNMRQLLNRAEELLSQVTLFAGALEYHKAYFNLYDTIDKLRTRYFQEITIFESGRYSMEMEIKHSILGRDSSQFAFRTFVIDIKADISILESKIHALEYNYSSKRQYAQSLVGVLTDIKHIVVKDPRYQQELFEWEQARLQRLQLEAMQAQARLERERADVLRQQNRILEERNRIEREKVRNQEQALRNNQMRNNNTDIHVNIDFIV